MPRPIALDEPNMSDTTLLVSVEDLINMAMGPQEGNCVDFKMVQAILHILARQMRLLEQKVIVEMGELPPPTVLKPPKQKEPSTSTDTGTEKQRASARKKGREEDIQEEPEGRRHSRDRSRSVIRDTSEVGVRDKSKGRADKTEQKDKERAEKEALKEKEKMGKMSQKEREKAEKEAQKEKEKYDKMSQKEKDKADKEKQKEKEKYDKMSQKEKDKADKEAQKEKEKYDKMSQKEKEKYDKMSQKEKDKADKVSRREKNKAEQDARKEGTRGKGEDRDDGGGRKASIAVKEVKSKAKEKVLVVEKGPTTRSQEAGRRQSIEVVTRSQFALLEAAVEALRERAGPLPALTLPDNQQLRSDLAAGSVSLTDAMQAMQVSARVQAAEAAIGRLGGLLTQLAARSPGGMPADYDDDEDELDGPAYQQGQQTHRQSTTSRKSVMIQAKATKGETGHAGGAVSKRQSVASGASRASAARPSVSSRGTHGGHVTHPEMNDAVQNLRDELMRNVQNMTNRATSAADTASNFAKSVSEKLDVALGLDARINGLQSLVNDYSEQLSGFDAGLTTQMQSFQEQMMQMRNDLNGGLAQLDNANNNAETAAVMELTERYDLLVADLDHTLLAHQALTTFQEQLSVDFRSLLECVEMLREQKADRDEVLDGLRDKADNERLAGLLREEEFAEARAELERRLDMCHDKFRRQDAFWVAAIKDLMTVVQTKAELMELLKTRDETTEHLQEMQNKIRRLAIILGEPKAAVLTRKLARGALCGACQVPALMEPEDATSGKPPALPAALPSLGTRQPPVGAEEPCTPEWRPPESPELRTHTCHRWVGGSHTLLDVGARKQAGPLPALPVTSKKYIGPGRDGRLYMLETELEPCLECNPLETEAPAQPGGGGDGAGQEPLQDMAGPVGSEPADGAGETACDPLTEDKPDKPDNPDKPDKPDKPD